MSVCLVVLWVRDMDVVSAYICIGTIDVLEYYSND